MLLRSLFKTRFFSFITFKGAVSRNSAKIGNFKMPVKEDYVCLELLFGNAI